jgi:RNA polymerase sigma-70 factor, ECF subfamily
MRQSENTQDNFSLLHNRLYGKVFSYVRMRIRNVDEAEDIVQDVFLKAYASWGGGVELEENTAKNYLFMIARQRMIDLWRSARNKYETEVYTGNSDEESDDGVNNFDNMADDSPLPEDLFQEDENKRYVLDLLNKLKPAEREILALRFLEEMEYKELAKVYKTSEDNIRQKVSRSLQNLKKVAQKSEN